MREISAKAIEDKVRELCIQANRHLPADICRRVEEAHRQETQPLAQNIMQDLLDNIDAAEAMKLPVCQDTGMAVVFVRLGQEVHITGGLLEEAVNRGVSRGYLDGRLRCSVVGDPLRRVNTGDNTPAVLHLTLTAGGSAGDYGCSQRVRQRKHEPDLYAHPGRRSGEGYRVYLRCRTEGGQ